jgi:hypothetical protein
MIIIFQVYINNDNKAKTNNKITKQAKRNSGIVYRKNPI